MDTGCCTICIIKTLNLLTDFNWKKLWSLVIPPKVKNFIWRSLQNCIPTLDNLRKKHVEVYPICPVCSSFIETLDHILLLCSFAQQCWELSKLGLRINTNDTFARSFMDAFQVMKLQEFQFLCGVA